MFEWEFSEIAERLGAEASLRLKFKALDIVRPVLIANHGKEEEDVLWIFKSPVCALKGAIAMKAALKEYNKEQENDDDQIHVTGYGMHFGSILFIPETDIHWGDPVNTSSKLG